MRTRDVADLEGWVDGHRLATCVLVLALKRAGVFAHSSHAQVVGANMKTTERCNHLLARIGLARNLPAWGVSRIERLE